MMEGVIGTRVRATGGCVRNGHLPFMETVPVLYVHIAREPPCPLVLWLCRRQLRVPESNSVLVPSEG